MQQLQHVTQQRSSLSNLRQVNGTQQQHGLQSSSSFTHGMEEVEHPQQYASLQPSVFNFMSSATSSTTPSLTNNVQRQQQQQHDWLQPSQLTNGISQEQPYCYCWFIIMSKLQF